MDKKITAPPDWQTTVQHPTMPMLDTRYWNMPDPATRATAMATLELPNLTQLSDGKSLKDSRISNDHKGPGD